MGISMPDNASAFVEELVRELGSFGRRPAVGVRGDFGVRWRTYEALQRDILKTEQWLAAMQIGEGDRVLIWSRNNPEWVGCLFAVLLRGAVLVPVDATASPEFIKRIAAGSAARLVFHEAGLDPAFLDMPAKRLESISGETLPQAQVPRCVITRDHPAVVMHTSGTTSEPRGVILTHGNIQAQIARFLRWRRLIRLIPFRILVIAPLSHVQGLLLGAFLPLSLGLGVIFVRSLHPPHLLRTLRDNRVTLFSTVPRVLSVLTRGMEAQPYKSGPLTLGERLGTARSGWVRRHILFMALNRAVGLRFWIILVGGAALPTSDERFWRDTGRFVIQGYGLTETTALVAFNGPFSRSVGSIGKQLKHVSIAIAEDGELVVSGPNVSPGCIENGGGSLNGVSYQGASLRTGDLVRRAGRRLYFVGRKKEIIVLSEGFNVSPADVEDALSRSAGVRDAVAIAKKTEQGEEVHAILLLTQGADPAQAVRQANRLLLPEQRIRSWSIWPHDDFPRTALLKVRRDEVKAGLATLEEPSREGLAPGASEKPVTPEAISSEPERCRRVTLLARYLTETPPEVIHENQAQLAMDFGLSSLDFVELLARLEERCGRKLDRAVLPENASLSSVHAALADQAARPSDRSRLPFRQPAWAESPPLTALRAIVRPLVVAFWAKCCASCSAVWRTDPDKLIPPFFLAVAPHRHWLDAFAVSAVLPQSLARRILIVTNRDFSEFFDPSPSHTSAERISVGLGYYAGLPLTFPFTIVPPYGSTREGLLETMRWVDRGYCPLVFPKGILFGEIDRNRHDRGPAVLASEAGIPIVPVWIEGEYNSSFRSSPTKPRAHVLFGAPIEPGIGSAPDDLRARLEVAWRSLASMKA